MGHPPTHTCYSRGFTEPIHETDITLYFGQRTEGAHLPLGLTEHARAYHLACFGITGTRKSTLLLPTLANQDFKNKSCGVTIIASSSDVAYTLYTLARRERRKVHLLKPSIHNEIATKLLWEPAYNYDYVNEHILNYKEAIRKREIVIIDMEPLKYKKESIRATAMLLTQLQLDLQETDITARRPHRLYVDDAGQYLPFLEDIILSGKEFNCAVTMFFQSRGQLISNGRNYSDFFENNVLSYLYLNALNINDIDYVSRHFSDNQKFQKKHFLRNRAIGHFLIRTISPYFDCITADGRLQEPTPEEQGELVAASKRMRATLLRKKRNEREQQLNELVLLRQKAFEAHRFQELQGTSTLTPVPTDEVVIESKPTEVESSIAMFEQGRSFSGDEPKTVDVSLIQYGSPLDPEFLPSAIETPLLQVSDSLLQQETVSTLIHQQIQREEKAIKREVHEAEFQKETEHLNSHSTKSGKRVIEDFSFQF